VPEDQGGVVLPSAQDVSRPSSCLLKRVGAAGDMQVGRRSGEQGIKWFNPCKRFTDASAALASLCRT
jgi:hypothetical protein